MSFSSVISSPPPNDRHGVMGPPEFGAPPGMPGIGRETRRLTPGHAAPMNAPEHEREPEPGCGDTGILIGTSITALAEGLRPWLESPARGWHVLEVRPTTATLEKAIVRHEADAIVLTEELTPDRTLAGVVHLRQEARFVVITLAVNPLREATFVRQGATGVIAASASRAQTVDALDAVLSGRAAVSAEALRLISGPPSEAPELTKRQRDVLERLAMGHTTAQIAQELVVTPSTVKTHIKHIQERFGVPGQLALVANARTLLTTGAIASTTASVGIVSQTT
jgi:DNA-binding NarL/FixJ family response regulator